MASASAITQLVQALRLHLAPGLVRVLIYGSSATGDVLAGYSDVDLLVELTARIDVSDVIQLQRAIGEIDPAPYSYFQPTFLLGPPTAPTLVPGTFHVLAGPDPGPSSICGPQDFKRKGDDWLAGLPGLAGDAGEWRVATRAHIPRRARLQLTRVKPSLRAPLVRLGGDPEAVWAATWDQLAVQAHSSDPALGEQVDALLHHARQVTINVSPCARLRSWRTSAGTTSTTEPPTTWSYPRLTDRPPLSPAPLRGRPPGSNGRAYRRLMASPRGGCRQALPVAAWRSCGAG